ncbi:MAG TPA: VTT domain-containing protein [Polyangiaceae bacterium]
MPAAPTFAFRRVLLVLGCAALVPLVPFLIVGELPGDQWLSAHEHDDRTFAATGAALLAADVLLPVPSSVIGALLGARLGFAAGFAFALAGLCAGAGIGYALGRLLPLRFSRSKGDASGAGSRTAPALLLIVLSRPVPVLAEAIAITAGVTRVPLPTVALGVVLGNVLYAAALAGNGAALLPDHLAGPGLVLPMLLPVISWLAWRWATRRRRESGSAPSRPPAAGPHNH